MRPSSTLRVTGVHAASGFSLTMKPNRQKQASVRGEIKLPDY